MLSEIPFLFPEDTKRSRFLVKDDKSVQRTTNVSREHALPVNESLIGSASVSLLDNSTQLVTYVIMEEPSVLIVTMVGKATVSIEIDLSTQDLETPVKIQAFADGSRIRLMLADARANLMRIDLDASDLSPLDIDILSVSALMEEANLDYSGAELESSMISFLNPTVALVAISPYALSVDWISQSLLSWSHVPVLSAGITDVFFKATDILLGKADEPKALPPIAALTSIQVTDHVFLVFTLHSDASMRRWKLDLVSSNLPTESVILTVDLPDPSTWINQTQNSIAMCSRMYQSAFVIAIHIQSAEEGSTLTVVHAAAGATKISSQIQLTIPDGVTSLVDMDLSATNRCQLLVFFKLQDQGPILVTYPPSYTSIISSKPILTPQEYTLDGWAIQEYDRIDNLALAIEEDVSIEQALHSVDTHYLKALFRPIYPRGNGAITGPSARTVYKTLSKLVHGYTHDESRTTELECLRALHEWKRSEGMRSSSRSSAASLSARISDLSVYEAYSPQANRVLALTEDIANAESENEESFKTQVDEHMGRWRKFLQTVWHEENMGRIPLLLSCLPSGRAILVRSTSISLIVDSGAPPESSSKADLLDQVALAILERIEHTKEKAFMLSAIEQKLVEFIASADDASDTVSILLQLGGLGCWAMNTNMAVRHKSQNAAIDSVSIQSTLKKMSSTEVYDWLNRSPLESSLPGLAVVAAGKSSTLANVFRKQLVEAQLRHSSCALYIQSMDSVRRLQVGRCLLLTGIQAPATASRTSFRSYLQALAILWSCGQHVPMPSVTSWQVLKLGESPPLKRLSFGGEPGSFLSENMQQTTMLDVRMMQLSQTMESDSVTSVDGIMVQMARAVMETVYVGSSQMSCLGKPYSLLGKELGVLPSPFNEAVASDHPRVALRLLTPSMMIPWDKEDSNVRLVRKEAVAECLLIESNEQKHALNSLAMRKRASTLLAPSIVEIRSDLNAIQQAYDYLTALGKQRQDSAGLLECSDSLIGGMQLLLGLGDGTIMEETRRLCNQQTARALFSPLFLAGRTCPLEQLGELERSAIKMLAGVLLVISNLLSHLSILERHTDRLGRLSPSSDGSATMLLVFTQDVVFKMESLLPEKVLKSMPEYISLWSRRFRHAEAAREWEIAYTACVKNPVLELRTNNCQRLVKAMADAGALRELLQHCGGVSRSGASGLDMLEIAAETLATENFSDRYTSASEHPVDYLGCLYALHASTGNWKRAAQAMDLRYLDAVSALEASAGNSSINRLLAVKDIAGSAAASANAISLVDDESDRFLVSGEFGPYPSLPILEEAELAPKSILKRGRGNDSPLPGEVHPSYPRDDRLSRFMTECDVEGRAIRAAAFLKLFTDSASSASNTLVLHKKPTVETDRAFIGTLASHGYFQQAFVVAKGMVAGCEDRSGGTMPGGRDLRHDILSHLLLTFIAPVAAPSKDHASDDVDMEDTFQLQRPTLSQLHDALNNFGVETGLPSYTCGPKWVQDIPSSAKEAAAMELLRRMTLAGSSLLAVEVAECLLDRSTCRTNLPSWLQSLLLGIDEEGGLFAKSSKSKNKSDPSALMGLYLNRGMYKEACEVVSTVLSGKSRKTRASSRLPEKGDIDYVPYHKIDLLWNLIQESIASGYVITEEKDEMLASRTKMEESLAMHFDLMKISQMGLQSARMLH